MADIDYPAELAAIPPMLDGHKDDPQDQAIRSNMDAGAPKVRRKFTAGSTILSRKYRYTKDQLAAFKTFYHDTLAGGILRFNITPTSETESKEARYEKPYSFHPSGSRYFIVSVQMRIFD